MAACIIGHSVHSLSYRRLPQLGCWFAGSIWRALDVLDPVFRFRPANQLFKKASISLSISPIKVIGQICVQQSESDDGCHQKLHEAVLLPLTHPHMRMHCLL